jgi:hypothetical protein
MKNTTHAYRTCQDASGYVSPIGMLAFRRATYVGPEVDQWLNGLTGWMAMSLMRDGEDFTRLADEGQRVFLCLAGEVLFGPRSDAWLRDDCYRIATEPI